MNKKVNHIGLFAILFVAGASQNLAAQTPNWSEHVAPILYNNCTGCHIEGGIGPFSLVGYNKASTYAGSVKSATAARRMPPWPADVKYQRYAHERILSTEEIETIKLWADNGKPMGDTTKAPKAPTLSRGSAVAGANINLKMPDYNVTTSSDEYRCFVLPSGLTQDEYMTAIEVIPGNLRVVHHALIFYDTSKTPVQLDAADPKPGYLSFGGTGSSTSQLIGLWVPGSEPYFFPSGFGIPILKKSNIILQIHYPGQVNNITDSTRVILKTTKNSLRPVAISPALSHTAPTLLNGPLYIPANQIKTFNNKYTVPLNVSVFTVGPHMHLLGKSIKAFGVTPAADTIRFFDIPKWDFHWQRAYSFRNLLKIQGGTAMQGEATYDNTTANPNNPNQPPQAVGLGEGTGDEMFLVYFWYTLYQSGDENIAIDNGAMKNISKSSMVTQTDTRLFPNPAESAVTITDSRFTAGRYSYSILSAEGSQIENGLSDMNNAKSVLLDVSRLKPGIYQILIRQGETHSVSRLIRL
jgi:hypothetical protein